MLRAIIKARILWRTDSFCTLTTYSKHHACLVSNIQSRTQEEIRFSGVNFCKRSTFVLNYHKQLQNPSTALVHTLSTISMSENKYIVGYARLGTSSCKKCKSKIDKGGLRIGKVVSNPFSDEGGDMKQWYHPSCMFETFKRARATTKKIEEPEDMEGFGDLQQEDKDSLNKMIDGKFRNNCCMLIFAR